MIDVENCMTRMEGPGICLGDWGVGGGSPLFGGVGRLRLVCVTRSPVVQVSKNGQPGELEAAPSGNRNGCDSRRLGWAGEQGICKSLELASQTRSFNSFTAPLQHVNVEAQRAASESLATRHGDDDHVRQQRSEELGYASFDCLGPLGDDFEIGCRLRIAGSR